MKKRKLKIRVGDVWSAKSTEFDIKPGQFLAFLILAQSPIRWEKGKIAESSWLGVKIGLKLDPVFVHMFDDFGEETGDLACSGFCLTRRSKRDPAKQCPRLFIERQK